MKYKVGDKVRIRRDLMTFERYGSQTFVKQMEKYKGMPATISEVFSDTYCIKEDKGENWYWTDEMFEADDELTAEEAIKIQAEMCRSMSSCADCPIFKEKGDYICDSFRMANSEKLVEILKQWKAYYKKKPIETEIVYLIKVMKEEGDYETCIYAYEIDANREKIDEKMEELVKQYYEENGGKIYAKFERICRAKS